MSGCWPVNAALVGDEILQFAHAELIAPVHLDARRDPSGAIDFSWIGRTRLNGDSWLAEVPLGEEAEEYALSIVDGASIARSVTTTAPLWRYTLDQQMADWGAPPKVLSWRVAQVSRLYGAGQPAETTSRF